MIQPLKDILVKLLLIFDYPNTTCNLFKLLHLIFILFRFQKGYLNHKMRGIRMVVLVFYINLHLFIHLLFVQWFLFCQF